MHHTGDSWISFWSRVQIRGANFLAGINGARVAFRRNDRAIRVWGCVRGPVLGCRCGAGEL